MTLAKSYEPYGSVLNSSGSATSIFAYAGEQIDYSGLIFLRARYMQPTLGLFLARDPWSGEAMRPGSMNGFNYAEGDPINRTDPSGQVSEEEKRYMRYLYDNYIQDVVLRLHDPALTNLSDGAFAAMIAAKFLVEDATDYADDQPAGEQRAQADQIMLNIPDWASLGIQVITHRRYSWGPANIHYALAQQYLEWWEQNHANLPSGCFLLEAIDTEYYTVRNNWQWNFPFTSPYKQVARELVTDKGAVQGTALAILEASDRARKYWQSIGQPSHELSAYTIALGVLAYNEPDSEIYPLSKWKTKGFAWDWVDTAVPWVADFLDLKLGNFLKYTDEEKAKLDPLRHS